MNDLKKINTMRLVVSRSLRRCDRCGHTEPHVGRLVCDVPADLCPWKWVCADCIDAVVNALGLDGLSRDF